ncbi:MAG: 5-oxoprolinase subunit PxpA [Balneolales bacterium]|nr:5-oxoprolinase subunit PxpA [Balneolales bacterium]
MKSIDLNCDLGEWRAPDGAEKDAQIMPFITSCNVACGGHIGDKESMKRTIETAKHNLVGIGAHPGYPDRDNFGRIVMNISSGELKNSLKKQISELVNLLEKAGEPLHHVKPHGALYNHAARDALTSKVILEAIRESGVQVPLYAQQGTVFSRLAEDFGFEVVCEVFADRAYEDDLSLRSRTLEGAILHKKEEVLAQIEQMVLNEEVITFSGNRLPIVAQTICLHSDTEGSIYLAKEIHEFLKSKDVAIVRA